MERAIRIGVSVLSALAFFGYAFLSNYYGRFGIRLQDVPLDPSHYLMRLLDLMILRPEFLALFIVASALILGCFAQVKLDLWGRRLRPWTVLLPILAAVLYSCYQLTKDAAIDFAERDIDPRSSALRQLVCLRSGSEPVDTWVAKRIEQNRKIMILLNSNGKVVLFLAPLQPDLPVPAVTVFEIGVNDDALLAHAVSGVDIGPDRRNDSC